MTRPFAYLVALTISLALLAGCKDSASATPNGADQAVHQHDDHDHEHGNGHDHDHSAVPKSFAAAVDQLVSLRNAIRDGFAKNDVDAAHGPLHDVGHLLEDLAKLAESHQPAVDVSAVKKDADELFDLFGKVDEKLHGDEGATYSEVAEKVDAAVERLRQLASGAPAAEPAGQP